MPRRLPFPRLRRRRTWPWWTRITYCPERTSGTRRWKGVSERPMSLTVTYLGAAGRKLMRQDLLPRAESQLHRRVRPDEKWRELQLSSAAGPVSPSLRARSPGAALLHVGAFHRQCLLRRLLSRMCRRARRLSDRGSSDYDIRQTFSGAVSYDIPAPGSGIWKSIFGNWSTDSIVYARTAPPVNVVTGQNHVRPVPVGSHQRAASESRSRRAALDLRPERRRRKANQQSGIQHPHRTGPRKSGTQRPARIRRDRGRSDAAQAVQTPGAPLPPGARRLLQHLQPPQLRPADQLHDLSSLRPGDPDARSLARQPAARPAASIRCTRSAARARRNWR